MFPYIFSSLTNTQELAPDPRSVSPSLGCRRYVIKPLGSLPTGSLGIEPSELLPQLDKEELYSLISDVTVSPKLARTLAPTPSPRMVEWSPRGILNNHRCTLAVLTDMGGLALYILSNNEYVKAADISLLWLNHCQTTWSRVDPQTPSAKFKELRIRAEMVKITAMCWLGNGVELATVSKSGLVALWKIKANDDTPQELTANLTSWFDCGLRNVTALHWNVLTSESYLLITGSMDGRIRGFTFSPTKLSSVPTVPINISPVSQDLWQEEDKITPTHLTSWPWRNGIIFIAVKGAFVVTFYLDKRGNKLTFCAYRCCDTSVNGLAQISENEVLIATRSVRLTRLVLSLTMEGALKITTESVENYINVSHMGCYGLSMTQNKVICFILLSVNQSYDHLRLREPTQVVICSVSGLLEPQKVLQDPHRPVAELWDCLELLRVQMLQKVLVSEVSYPRAALDMMNIDQLTSTLWWTTFATAAEEDDVKHQGLVSLRQEVETLVVSCHFFKRIASLLSCPIDSLSSFQLHSLGLLCKWLNQLKTLSPEFSTTLITAKTLSQQLETLEHQFPTKELCSICGSNITGLAELFISECMKGHRVPRCSLSLVQCSQLPYYVCAQCSALAHPSAVEECGVICNLCGGVLRIDEDILPLT